MTRRFGLVLVALLAAVSALAPAPVAADHDTTFKCLVGINKEFQTIQSAVDDPLCLYVQIDAAVWREPIVVRHSLTLAGTSFRQGVNTFITTFRPPEGQTDPYTMVQLIGRKVRLKVKHIVFEGPSAGPGLVGIRAEKDTRLTIRDSEFVDISRTPADDTAGFVAIHAGVPLLPGERGPQITYTEITRNRFVGHQTSAIVLEGQGTSALIQENFISGGASRPALRAAPVGIVVKGGATAIVDRNDVVNHRRTGGGGIGILLDAAAPDILIQYNNVDRANTGIAINGTTGTTIFRNGLDGNNQGIVIGAGSPAHGLQISHNRADDGGVGIRLEAGTGSVILKNLLRANRETGIAVGAGAARNSIRANTATLSGGFGLVDVTTGSDGSGTANMWRNNSCSGNNAGGPQSSPRSLCAQ